MLVYLRASGELLLSLAGHVGTVNACSWSPTDHHTFASASDDCSVRIWGLTSRAAATAEQDGSEGAAGAAAAAAAPAQPLLVVD